MQLKLETNLPVIFLTLLVISIVVVGFLELKKIHERLKVLEYHVEESKKIENEDLELQKIQPEKEKTPLKNTYISEQQQKTFERVEKWQMDNSDEKNIKENIIETLNKKDEYIEEIDDEEREERVEFGGAMFHNPNMIYQIIGDEREQIIEQMSKDKELTFDTEENMINEDKYEYDDEGEIDEDKGETDEEKGETDEDKDEKEGWEETEEEEINFKEIPADDDFEKEKIVVDESYSVNELKVICKNLGLQHSGNKTTLINRIMDNQ